MKLESISASCSSSEWFYQFRLLQILFICNFFGQWRRKLIIHPYATLSHSQSMASPVHHMRHHDMNRGCFLMAWTLLLLSYQPVSLLLCLSMHFQLSCVLICPNFPFAIICILILCLFLQYLSQSLSFHCSCNVYSFNYHLHSRPNDSKPEMQKRSPVH